MTPLRRFALTITPFFILGACSELIGLSDYEKGDAVEGGGGEDSTGGKGGKGGSVGKGGTSGLGGEDTGGTGGALAGRSGSGGAGGEGGEPDGGDTGQGGSTGGTGKGGKGGTSGTSGQGGTSGAGQGGMSGGGTGGAPPCTEIEVGTLADLQIDRTISPHVVAYSFDFSPDLGLPSSADLLEVQFWNGGSFDGVATGTFPLATGRDSNNSTCSRCILGYQDTASAVSLRKTYFQTAGTLTVEAASQQMDGFPNMTFTNVTLREATIDAVDGHSTIIPGGLCLHIDNASFNLPPEWNCPLSWQTDADCDCGCGVLDATCEGPEVSWCDLCWCDDYGDCIGLENENSNWTCL